MKSTVKIDAGVCGFITTVVADSQDYQNAELEMTTNCPKIEKYIAALKGKLPIDAYQEINPNAQSVILSTAKEPSLGCCVSCVVPLGVFKAMQSACGLALAKNISLEITSEN